MTQDASKKTLKPKRFQTRLKRAQGVLWRPKTHPKRPKMPSRRPTRMPQDASKKFPKRLKMRLKRP